MPLAKRDKEFRLPKISTIDFKHLEMDRVLTGLFQRLAHNGAQSRLTRKWDLSVKTFVDEFLDHPEWFSGFGEHRDILERWVETHLMDVVNRGKPTQAIAAPRPLHGFTYRFRNPKHSRDYGAAQQLYEMLAYARHASGRHAIEHLTGFFFQGHNKTTGRAQIDSSLDIETIALLRLLDQVEDAPDTRGGREGGPPLCIGAADLLAEDVQRLLFYRPFIPRSVMVDYMKLLLSFHLALYHLRLLKLLPAMVKRQSAEPVCADSACPMNPKADTYPQGDCPYQIGIFLDLSGHPDSAVAKLAERSADTHYRRIPAFVRAYFATKKLDEFATDLVRRGKLLKPPRDDFTVDEVLRLQGSDYASEREKFFGQRVSALLEDNAKDDEGMDPEVASLTELGLPEFETYIELLVALRGPFHRRYIIECLDSLMQKNRPGAMLAQGRTRNAPRRFVLDSRLLEVLLQIAVLRQGGPHRYYTGEMRVDELLTYLRERYGLHIDRLPAGDGFGEPGIDDRQALRGNLQAFIERLREIGFYRNLSDAYVTQTVTPRYRIDRVGGTEQQGAAR